MNLSWNSCLRQKKQTLFYIVYLKLSCNACGCAGVHHCPQFYSVATLLNPCIAAAFPFSLSHYSYHSVPSSRRLTLLLRWCSCIRSEPSCSHISPLGSLLPLGHSNSAVVATWVNCSYTMIKTHKMRCMHAYVQKQSYPIDSIDRDCTKTVYNKVPTQPLSTLTGFFHLFYRIRS